MGLNPISTHRESRKKTSLRKQRIFVLDKARKYFHFFFDSPFFSYDIRVRRTDPNHGME